MTGRSGPMPNSVSIPCLCFERPGRDNTDATLARAAARWSELGLRRALVASSSGETGLRALDHFPGESLVVVSHSTGYRRPNHQEMRPENRRRLEAAGAAVLTCQHAFGGVNRAVRRALGTYQLDEIIAASLRIFGQGVKVAVEIALMAADAGLAAAGEPCVSIGGTDGGADAALVLKPANAQAFFDLRVMEILAKPRLAE